jgi:hypothetical protein
MSNYLIFSNGLEHFLLNIMHLMGPPSSYGLWYFSMHIWLAHKFNGIDLHCCVHGGEHIATHDAVQDSFTSNAKDVEFGVSLKQTHVFSTLFF